MTRLNREQLFTFRYLHEKTMRMQAELRAAESEKANFLARMNFELNIPTGSRVNLDMETGEVEWNKEEKTVNKKGPVGVIGNEAS